MISIMDLTDAYRAALVASPVIRAWCRLHYGRHLSVQVGMDGSNPPGQEDFPLAVLSPGSDPSEQGEESAVQSVSLDIDWAVLEERETVTETTREYNGVRRSDELGQLIREVLKSATTQVSLSRCQYALDPVSMHPVYGGSMAVTVEYPNLIGAEIVL